TCACSRRSAGPIRRCSAGRCRSTARAPAAPPSQTSGFRPISSAGTRCWPGPPGCWASWPRNGAGRSAWTSASRSRTKPHSCPPSKGATGATVAAVSASRHHPFYCRASTSTGADRPPFADEWVAKIEGFRQTLTRARADVLVMVGSDHFHQLWLDNMPQFLIGKAPFYDANFYNEEREFGLPRMFVRGDEDLSGYWLRQGSEA